LVVEQQRIDHMAQLHREGIHNIGVLVDVFLSDAHLQNALYKDPADRSVFVRGLVVNAGQPAPVLNPVKSASDCVAQFYTGDVFNQLPFKGGRVHKCMLALVRTLLCSVASSAGVEQAFSLAGLIDSALRTSLGERTFEKLLVTGHAMARVKAGAVASAQDGRGIRRAHHQSGTVKFLRPSAAKYFPKYKLPPKKPYFLQNIFIFSKYILWQPCWSWTSDLELGSDLLRR
jgi:hypothetical protein